MMLIPFRQCTVFVEGPRNSNVCVASKADDTHKVFKDRIIDRLKTQANLSDKDTQVFSVFFSLPRGNFRYDRLRYETIHQQEQSSQLDSYSLFVQGDCHALDTEGNYKEKYIQPSVEITSKKVCKTLFNMSEDSIYDLYNKGSIPEVVRSFEDRASVGRKEVYSATQANKANDPMLKAFFNSENLTKVTIAGSWNRCQPLVEYKEVVDKGCTPS